MLADLTLEEERTNLYSFLRKFETDYLSQTKEVERSFKLLYDVWEKTSAVLWDLVYWNDYFRCGNIVLRCSRTANDSKVQAQLLAEMGWVCLEWENFDAARNYFGESLQLYEGLKHNKGRCRLLRYFGVLSHRQEQFNSAIAYYREALEIVLLQRKQAPTDERWAFQEAEIHNIFGETYLELKDFSTSCRELALSLSQYRTLSEQHPKYRYFLTDPLLNMGQWHFQQGDLEQAKPYYQDCLQLSRELSRRDTTARALLHLAELAEVWGNVEDAIAFASEAERVAGTEATSVRDRAARFKAKLLSQNQSSSQR